MATRSSGKNFEIKTPDKDSDSSDSKKEKEVPTPDILDNKKDDVNAVDGDNKTRKDPNTTDAKSNVRRDDAYKGSDPVLTDDDSYAEPAKNSALSGGPDNSDSTRFVTAENGALRRVEGGTTVDETDYDYSGNGRTDNLPVDWDENAPMGTVTTRSPAENASVSRNLVTTEYALPAPVDDKGLGKNDPDVEVSEVAAGARESALANYNEEDGTNLQDDSQPK